MVLKIWQRNNTDGYEDENISRRYAVRFVSNGTNN